jgi:hypothetical protein
MALPPNIVERARDMVQAEIGCQRLPTRMLVGLCGRTVRSWDEALGNRLCDARRSAHHVIARRVFPESLR